MIQVEPNSETSVRDTGSILKAGDTVWRVVHAGRVAMVVDAADYFRHLERAFANARRSILIAGWDFNGSISLQPDRPGTEQLGQYLRRLVEERPELTIHVLVWAYGPIYSSRQMRVFPKEPWADHPRIHICYDRHHPWRGCHHQKIVCIDDAMAFCGGIDLTVHRWDTRDHLAIDRRRKDLGGGLYTPVHDVQLALEGEAASALGDLLRERWRACKGDRLEPASADGEYWPDELEPDLRNIPVGISRTIPSSLARRNIGEIEQLNEAALKAANYFIYIETQYLTCRRIGHILSRKLLDPQGPEIVIVVPQQCHGGVLEQIFMGGNRNRLVRSLRRADIHGRLRVVYPVVVDKNGHDEIPIFVHSKLMIIDNWFARIGSSNLNNRSRGMDTECDVCFEARTPGEQKAVERMCHDLLAEHLGMSRDAVSAYVDKHHSLAKLLDQERGSRRRLKPVRIGPSDGPEGPVPLTTIVDPKKPLRPIRYLRKLLEIVGAKSASK